MVRIRKGGAKRGCSPEWWIEATTTNEFNSQRFKDYGYTYILDAKFFESKEDASKYLRTFWWTEQ